MIITDDDEDVWFLLREGNAAHNQEAKKMDKEMSCSGEERNHEGVIVGGKCRNGNEEDFFINQYTPSFMANKIKCKHITLVVGRKLSPAGGGRGWLVFACPVRSITLSV